MLNKRFYGKNVKATGWLAYFFFDTAEWLYKKEGEMLIFDLFFLNFVAAQFTLFQTVLHT